jgi:hypothetical protein
MTHWMPRGFEAPKEAKLGDALKFLSDEHREVIAVPGRHQARRLLSLLLHNLINLCNGRHCLVLLDMRFERSKLCGSLVNRSIAD